ncbi:glycoside hydrolase [Gamsiella multidivaricata]|uniref:glycoside hydrolase n=1 Tax=Gamsiella multidivaricata TaxID=101098 RepID=UPI00221F94EE|nr:glycoside hydrolase [Gamsiella multidivaricata]KAI7821737.1 glycoside hydrolase [Gamsiella multidivaricata]
MNRPKLRSWLSLGPLVAVGTLFLSVAVVSHSAQEDSSMDATNSFLNNIRFTHGDPSLLNDENSALAAAKAQNQSLLWGLYRPNLYFGTRPRLPDTVMTGLMWYGTQNYAGVNNIRHGCEERDGFEKYGWLKNDGRTFGVQQLKDTRNNVELKTEFIKVPGGDHGGSWGVRISGKPIRKEKPMSIAGLYYIGIDGEGQFKLVPENFKVTSPIVFDGDAKDLGDFEFVLEQTKGSNKDDPIHFFGASPPAGTVWRVKDYVRNVIIQGAQELKRSGKAELPPKDLFSFPDEFIDGQPTILVFQMHYDAEFEFEVRFSSKSSQHPVTSQVITSKIDMAENAFDERFEKTLQLKRHGFNDSMVEFAKATFSNLIGGIGYFYGTSIIDESPTYEDGQYDHLEGPVARRPHPDPQPTPPASLFSAVPSRSFFPRGFYWDEGFHQTMIGQWDNDLSLEIIESWFNRQDYNGWIQREQILGDEARGRVRSEFHVQYPEHANPPTLIMAISSYLDRLQNVTQSFAVDAFGESNQTPFGAKSSQEQDVTNAHLLNPKLALEYLSRLYPKLITNYHWMRKTMRGRIREYGRESRSRVEGYRWGGRTATHTLTSGLDDYPRAPRPSVAELHVDLLSWIGFMSRNLKNIAEILGEEDDVEELEDHYKAIAANIDDLHWNEKEKVYCDLTVDEEDESYHVCHKGYISLFPMSLGILDPESEKLGYILDLMYDPEELWTPFGLRSLSAKDKFAGTGENYWRGPVWVNINYLVLHSLKTNYIGKGPYQDKSKKIYNELRENIINNVYKEYERTGYVWEHYTENTGVGNRSHPFTGWTSMVVKIMQMGPVE